VIPLSSRGLHEFAQHAQKSKLATTAQAERFVPGSVSTTRKSVLSLTSRLVRTSEPRRLRIRSLGSGKYSHQLFVIVTR
jgi:hypothetical protein